MRARQRRGHLAKLAFGKEGLELGRNPTTGNAVSEELRGHRAAIKDHGWQAVNPSHEVPPGVSEPRPAILPSMRIIAGEFRGRRLTSPEGRDTRPLLDRVREAMFSTLGDLVDDAVVLDLFSGTGSIGLEALSRGAASVTFIERDARALRALQQNVEMLAVQDRATVLRGDALAPAAWPEQADLILVDPPYPMLRDRGDRPKLIDAVRALYDATLRAPGALVLHTHPRDLDPADLSPLVATERVYGRTCLWYLWKAPTDG